MSSDGVFIQMNCSKRLEVGLGSKTEGGLYSIKNKVVKSSSVRLSGNGLSPFVVPVSMLGWTNS